jgi:hypothetical protein
VDLGCLGLANIRGKHSFKQQQQFSAINTAIPLAIHSTGKVVKDSISIAFVKPIRKIDRIIDIR